jgi:hypothetical protein
MQRTPVQHGAVVELFDRRAGIDVTSEAYTKTGDGEDDMNPIIPATTRDPMWVEAHKICGKSKS